jgi:hypothetical protein
MSRISPAKLTKEQLVDRWGAARAKAKKLDAEIEPLKEEFERRGLSVVAGEAWGVARSESTFSSLDVKAIRAEMGSEWCAKREKPQTRIFYNFAPVEAR